MNLDFENIDQLFEDSLDGLELKPSAQVKTQVQKGMFWHNTFTNTYFRVALALVFLLTVAGSFFLFNNSGIQISDKLEISETITNSKEQPINLPADNKAMLNNSTVSVKKETLTEDANITASPIDNIKTKVLVNSEAKADVQLKQSVRLTKESNSKINTV